MRAISPGPDLRGKTSSRQRLVRRTRRSTGVSMRPDAELAEITLVRGRRGSCGLCDYHAQGIAPAKIMAEVGDRLGSDRTAADELGQV